MSLYQNTRRPDGSRFETDTPMRECAFEAIIILYMVSIVSAAVAFNMGWIG